MFDLITDIADKSIAMRRYDDAERILTPHLNALLNQSSAGRPPTPPRLAAAREYALTLAEHTKHGQWLTWIFQIHASTDTLLPAEAIDRLYELVRQLKYDGVRQVREYVDVIRARRDKLSAAERFLLTRLEGLERVVSA